MTCVEKCGTARQVTDDNTLRRRLNAIFLTDNQGKKTENLIIRI